MYLLFSPWIHNKPHVDEFLATVSRVQCSFGVASRMKKQLPLILTILIILVLILAFPTLSTAVAQQKYQSETAILIPVSEDAEIYSPAPDNNGGQGETISVFGLQGSETRALLKFDIATYLPQGTPIISAQLILKPTSEGYPTPFRIYQVSAPWEEMTVTYNTQPLRENDPFLDYQFPVTEAPVEYDVTAFVQSWLDGSVANNGFQLVTQDVARSGFTTHAKESASGLAAELYVVVPADVAVAAPTAPPLQIDEIAYIDQQNNVWLVREDGTNARQLTFENMDASPQWSMDGLSLYFLRNPNPDQTKLMEYSFLTESERDITPTGIGKILDFTVSPPRGSIVTGVIILSYERPRPFAEPDPVYGRAWQSCLAQLNPAGTEAEEFYCEDSIFFAGLEATADGNSVLATESYFEFARPILLTVTGNKQELDVCCFNPSRVGDGDTVVGSVNSYFNRSLFEGTQQSGIFIYNYNDWRVGVEPLVISEANVGEPDVSPNGQKVAFTDATDQGRQIVVLDIPSGNITPVIAGQSPAWRPPIWMVVNEWIERKKALFPELETVLLPPRYPSLTEAAQGLEAIFGQSLPDNLMLEGLVQTVEIPGLEEENSFNLVVQIENTPASDLDWAMLERFKRLVLQEEAVAAGMAAYMTVQKDILDSFVDLINMMFSTAAVLADPTETTLLSKGLQDVIDLTLLNTSDAALRSQLEDDVQMVFDSMSLFGTHQDIIITWSNVLLETAFRADMAETLTGSFTERVQPTIERGVQTVLDEGTALFPLSSTEAQAAIQQQDIANTVQLTAEESHRFYTDVAYTLAWNEAMKDIVDIITKRLYFTWPASAWARVQQVALNGAAITNSWRAMACIRDYSVLAGQQIFDADLGLLPKCEELYSSEEDDWWPDWFDLPRWLRISPPLDSSISHYMAATERVSTAMEGGDADQVAAAQQSVFEAELAYADAVTTALALLTPPDGESLTNHAQTMLTQAVQLEMDMVGLDLLLYAYQKDPGDENTQAMIETQLANLQHHALTFKQTLSAAPEPLVSAGRDEAALVMYVPHSVWLPAGAPLALPVRVENLGTAPSSEIYLAVMAGEQVLYEENWTGLSPQEMLAETVTVTVPERYQSVLTIQLTTDTSRDINYVWVYQPEDGQLAAQTGLELMNFDQENPQAPDGEGLSESRTELTTPEDSEPSTARRFLSVFGFLFIGVGLTFLGGSIWLFRKKKMQANTNSSSSLS